MKWSNLYLITMLLAFISSAEAAPRMDLYVKIKTETGVSLKEAFQASEGKDPAAINNLKIYAKKAGIREIEKFFDEELKRFTPDDKRTADLTSQIALVRELNSNFEFLDKDKKLFLCLVIYQFNIKAKVLMSDLMDWDKNCSRQEKINTRPCQEKLYEVHTLADLANDIGKVVLARSEKAPLDHNLIQSIRERIARYEK